MGTGEFRQSVRFNKFANDTTLVRPNFVGRVEALGQLPGEDHGKRLISEPSEGHAKSLMRLMQTMDATKLGELCDGLDPARATIGNSWPRDERAILVEHRARALPSIAISNLIVSLRSQ